MCFKALRYLGLGLVRLLEARLRYARLSSTRLIVQETEEAEKGNTVVTCGRNMYYPLLNLVDRRKFSSVYS